MQILLWAIVNQATVIQSELFVDVIYDRDNLSYSGEGKLIKISSRKPFPTVAGTTRRTDKSAGLRSDGNVSSEISPDSRLLSPRSDKLSSRYPVNEINFVRLALRRRYNELRSLKARVADKCWNSLWLRIFSCWRFSCKLEFLTSERFNELLISFAYVYSKRQCDDTRRIRVVTKFKWRNSVRVLRFTRWKSICERLSTNRRDEGDNYAVYRPFGILITSPQSFYLQN